MPIKAIDWHCTAISYCMHRIGKDMLRLFIILFFLFFLSSQSKATEIVMPFGPNIEKLSLPDEWTFESIPYAQGVNLYYLSNGQSTIKIFTHVKQKHDDKILLCRLGDELYQLSPCAENILHYQNVVTYHEFQYDCHDESCKNLVETIKSNYVEKRSFSIDDKTFKIAEKWHLVTLAKFGVFEVYGFFYDNQIKQSMLILRRQATQRDDVGYFLNHFGFSEFAQNQIIADILAQNTHNFYFQSPTAGDALVMNINIDKNLNFYGSFGSKDNRQDMKELFDFLAQKFETPRFQQSREVQRPEFIKAQTVMGVYISDGYNLKSTEDIGFCSQYQTFDDYANFIKSNSRLDWKKVNYQGHEAIKADYKANDYPQQLMIYKMCLDKKPKSIYNLFQQQDSQEAYDAIDEKLTEALK